MNKKYIIGIMLLLAAAALTGCGGGGDSADPNGPADITMTASRAMALANSSDAVTIQAAVRKADGSSVADGTIVTFSVDTATLSSPTATTTNGTAAVSMTCAPVPGANFTAVVTAAAGNASRTSNVKFINQPSSVDVSVRFNVAVTNLAALQFKLISAEGATFDNNAQLVSRINNAAAGSTSIILAGFDPAAKTLTVGLANPGGFNTGTTPIIKATYAIAAGSGLPTFSVDAAGFTATDPQSVAIPQVTSAALVVTTVFDTE